MTRIKFIILFVSVVILLSLTILWTYPAWDKDKITMQENLKLVRRVNFLLGQAREVTALLKNETGTECHDETIQKLENIARRFPYVNAVHLYKNGVVYCSSLMDTFSLGPSFAKVEDGKPGDYLLLISGSKVFPDFVSLAYLKGNRHEGIVATINTYWLKSWFSKNGDNGINIDGDTLLSNFVVLPKGQNNKTPVKSINSIMFNFSIVSYKENNAAKLFWPITLGLVFCCIILIWSFIRLYRERHFPDVKALKKAIQHGEIIPYYQPVVDSATGYTCGAEVLARWKHPDKGLLSPDIFISKIDKAGLMIPMTRSLISQVKRDLDVLIFRLPDNFHISINLEATQEICDGLLEDLLAFNRSFSKKIKTVVELTERTDIPFNSKVIPSLDEMRMEGISIALDDFGTGFSNISKIDHLPVDIIKIDQVFIRKLNSKNDNHSLVDGIINIGKKRNLIIIAEGVENLYQREYLLSQGVNLHQGYLWSKPLPGMEFAKYLIWQKGRQIKHDQ